MMCCDEWEESDRIGMDIWIRTARINGWTEFFSMQN
jgi:hypothetical protein